MRFVLPILPLLPPERVPSRYFDEFLVEKQTSTVITFTEGPCPRIDRVPQVPHPRPSSIND
jgi:hypothetical protein